MRKVARVGLNIHCQARLKKGDVTIQSPVSNPAGVFCFLPDLSWVNGFDIERGAGANRYTLY